MWRLTIFKRKKNKYWYFKRQLKKLQNIKGDIVECGVAEGKSLKMFVELSGGERNIWGFDSFEGFPEPSKYDTGIEAEKGYFMVPLKKVQQLCPTTHLVKGFFQDTLKTYEGQIALLHLDVDLYESYKVALETLFPKVVPGGLILFDEYAEPTDLKNWPGAKKAIDEFFGENKKYLERDKFGKWFYVKR
jgi:hypothetical protein